MNTIIVHKDAYDMEGKELEKLLKNTKVIESTFKGVVESHPLVYRAKDSSFYGFVTIDRLNDVAHGHADDLKIQTAKLFGVEMKMYVSEPIYRKAVKDIQNLIEDIDKLKKKHLQEYAEENKLKETDVINVLKMALIKTTKGPELFDLLKVIPKKEVLRKLKAYQKSYKYRI